MDSSTMSPNSLNNETLDKNDQPKNDNGIDIKVAEKYGFHPLIHISDGTVWLDAYLMVLLLLETGYGQYKLSSVKFGIRRTAGRPCLIATKKHIPFIYPTSLTQIRYGYVDETNFQKIPFTRDEGYKYIIKTFIFIQSLLSQRSTEAKYIIIDLISPIGDDLLGLTTLKNDTAIIYINFHKMASVEQLLVTFLHELSHVFEGFFNNEDHGFTFYAIHIALNVIFLHTMKGQIPIDFDLIKMCKVSNSTLFSDQSEGSEETVVIID